MSPQTHCWWKEGICYQVWPASFKDSNGDGMGDLQGLISKLDYLKDLGVDFIWLSPCYDSPRHDMGYDIRNFEDIDASFGTLQDMDELIRQVHDRNMKLVLDLVANHTSDEHRWFQESMKSRDNEYSDFYFWRDPKIVDGRKVEPNNWASVFGGSAWKYVEARDQYYLHIFLSQQPDLNWENPKVRQAIYQSAIRFWLDRGIDGFRVDAVGLYSKPLDFPDAQVDDPTQDYHGPQFGQISNGPRMHEFLREQRKEALESYGDVVMIGELGHLSTEDLSRYIDPSHRELDMVFDMDVVAPNGFPPPPGVKFDFSLSVVRKGLQRPQQMISEFGRWSSVFLENHDNPRSISKFGSSDPKWKFESGKCLALLQCTLSGTMFIYQGQEIGMTNLPLDWPRSDMRDDWWTYKFDEVARKYPGDEQELAKVREAFQYHGRDHSRTPMQWTNEAPCGGFSTAKSWINPNETYKEGVTVAEQQQDSDSLWHFWRQAVALRKSNPATFIYGTTTFLDQANDNVMYFTKKVENDQKPTTLVVLNMSSEAQPLIIPSEIEHIRLGQLLLGTRSGNHGTNLEPWEGRVYELV